MTSKEKRERGMLFVADESDWGEMKRARRLIRKLNSADTSDFEAVRAIVRELFGKSDPTTFLNPPFYCDYGKNIRVGKNCFINYNCVMLDNALITLGDNCMIAPCVSVYTAGHPLYPAARIQGYEYGLPVTLGDNVWIGGNSVICPGVNIGDNSVIGAGSVVTRDVPAWTFAAGNPCRAIRKITQEDKKYYFRRREIDAETYKAIFDKD